jgi:pyridoxamine 5'-phosphate oxidase
MDWDESTLENLPSRIWEALGDAVGIPHSPMRTPVLSTTNRLETSVRTVVLRGVDTDRRHLYSQTHVRAAKVREIRSNQQVQMLFYHPIQKVQIRATAAAMVYHQDAMAREFWERLPLSQRAAYGTAEAPGTPLTEPGDAIDPQLRKSSSVEDLEAAYENFAVIAAEVDQFDWLHLREQGNVRANIRWTGGAYSGLWLVP